MGPQASEKTLPDPDQFPDRNVVIWDGQCVFCRSQVHRLYALDWTRRLAFISLHDVRVGQRYPELTYDQLMDQMWVIGTSGGRYGGADAIRYLSLIMPSLYPAAPLLYLPFAMPIWRRLYAWVAKRRYKIAGKACEGGTCHIHAGRPVR